MIVTFVRQLKQSVNIVRSLLPPAEAISVSLLPSRRCEVSSGYPHEAISVPLSPSRRSLF